MYKIKATADNQGDSRPRFLRSAIPKAHASWGGSYLLGLEGASEDIDRER